MVSLPRPAHVAQTAPRPNDAILFAVQDDVRSTLRVAWIDPDLRAVSSYPIFFTAAWSAMRPNVTRSFSTGAERVRAAADACLTGPLTPRNLDSFERLPGAEREVLLRTVQALHLAAPKIMIVLHAWAALARRQRIAGTGREEPPARRGVPEWQERLGQPSRAIAEEAEALLDEATTELGLGSTPSILQAAALWPEVIDDVWRHLRPKVSTPAWREARARVRRASTEALRALPHAMELQWDALSRRGLTEDVRRPLADRLTALAAAAPVNVLASTYLWAALGRAEVPAEI